MQQQQQRQQLLQQQRQPRLALSSENAHYLTGPPPSLLGLHAQRSHVAQGTMAKLKIKPL